MIFDDVRIQFGTIYDETIREEITNGTVAVETSSDSEFSNAIQTLTVDTKDKIAYLEQDYWLLDGSFIMPVNTELQKRPYNLCDDGSFENKKWDIIPSSLLEFTKNNNYVRSGKIAIRVYGTTHNYNCVAKHKSLINFKKNHIYYIELYAYDYSNVGGHVSSFIDIQVGGATNLVPATYELDFYIGKQQRVREQQKFNRYSFFGKYAGETQSTNFAIRFITTNSNYYNVYVDDVLLIDVTDMFGEGNEPSQSECEKLFGNNVDIYNIGYESYDTGNYDDTPVQGTRFDFITYYFTKQHDSYGIQLKFPETSIPKSFNITYYYPKGEAETIQVIDNTLSFYENKDNHLGWNSVRIALRYTNPHQRRRLQSINFGTTDIYTGDDLLSVSMNKNTDITSDYTDSNECTFEFFNNNRFDIHTIKDLSQRALDDTRVEVQTLAKGENSYKLFNVYYVNNENVKENGKIISFTAYDTMYKLNDLNFSIGKVHLEGRTLGQWVNDIVSDLKEKNITINIEVDSKISNIISYGYIPEVPYREALRLISQAGCGVLYVDKNNIIHISTYDNFIKNQSNILSDNIVRNTLNLNNLNKYMGVAVTEYTFIQNEDDYDIEEKIISKGETTNNIKEISDNYLITAGMGEQIANYQLEHSVKKYNYDLETVIETDIDIGGKYNIEDNEVIVTNVSYYLSYGEQTESLKGIDK